MLDLFDHKPSFDNFISLSNKMVVDALVNQSNQFVHIIGSQYIGKTHLLKAWIAKANLEHQSTIYLDAENKQYKEDIRQLATYYKLIAIDNIESLNDAQQVELFDLFNSIKLNNRDNKLLTSSRFHLENINNIREDLKTRILSGLNLQLKVPSDEELMEILKIYIAQEGIKLEDNELNYIVTHYTRNIGTLINTIKLIAERAVLENRNITIPLIRQFLNISAPGQ